MSKPQPRSTQAHRATLERRAEDVLAAAVPLPADEDALIDDLTEDEGRRFLAAILDA